MQQGVWPRAAKCVGRACNIGGKGVLAGSSMGVGRVLLGREMLLACGSPPSSHPPHFAHFPCPLSSPFSFAPPLLRNVWRGSGQSRHGLCGPRYPSSDRREPFPQPPSIDGAMLSKLLEVPKVRGLLPIARFVHAEPPATSGKTMRQGEGGEQGDPLIAPVELGGS